jgi:hypothetical protein
MNDEEEDYIEIYIERDEMRRSNKILKIIVRNQGLCLCRTDHILLWFNLLRGRASLEEEEEESVWFVEVARMRRSLQGVKIRMGMRETRV